MIVMWIEFFQGIGFLGFYTIWAFIVGAIAVFGLPRKFGKGWVFNILISWFFGAIAISVSPIGALVAAFFIRLALTGILYSIKIENRNVIVINKKATMLIPAAIIILLFFGIAAAIFAPPMEVEWYHMKDIDVIKLDSQPETSVADITWDDIKGNRLVSQEYALQIPKTMITETGWKLSRDWDGIYPIDNTLYWIMMYEPDKLINVGNPSPAYITVNAEDPADRQKIVENIEYSEQRNGLVNIIYQLITGKIRDVNIKLWLAYPFFEHGDTIFTHDNNGNPVWIAPAKMWFPSAFVTLFYEEQIGILVLDNEGEVKFYTTGQIRDNDVPEWLTQQILIDEDYTELRAEKWAKYGQWQGFINYYFQHENVFEIAQDLFFQYDKPKDRNYALIQLEPEGWERKAITHFIEIESSTKDFGTVTVYDARGLKLVGPIRALDDVRGQISLYSDWYAQQPLFKKIKDGYFYIVPVYSGWDESMVLRAVAVVNAKTEQVKLFKWGDIPLEEEEKGKNCKVVETEIVDSKTRIIIECE